MHQRALERAADIVGGNEALARYLKVSMLRLDLWLGGRETPPDYIFLRVVDLLSEQDSPVNRDAASD